MVQVRRTCVCGAVTTRCHRDYNVSPLLAVEIFHSQQHFVLLEAELRSLAYGEKHGVLGIPGTNSINHLVGLQQIFLAKKLLRLLVARVSSEHYTGKTLAVFLIQATLHRIHLQQFSTLISLRLFGESGSG